MQDEHKVPCRHCGAPTYADSLRECPGCWELRTRIESQPALARRMLEEAEKRTPSVVRVAHD
jgi:hypothetical protein